MSTIFLIGNLHNFEIVTRFSNFQISIMRGICIDITQTAVLGMLGMPGKMATSLGKLHTFPGSPAEILSLVHLRSQVFSYKSRLPTLPENIAELVKLQVAKQPKVPSFSLLHFVSSHASLILAKAIMAALTQKNCISNQLGPQQQVTF